MLATTTLSIEPDWSTPLDVCVADYFHRLSDKRAAMVKRLREQIDRLGPNEAVYRLDVEAFELKQSELTQKATLKFDKIMRSVESRAKGLSKVDPEDTRTLKDVIREHLSNPTPHKSTHTDADRAAVLELLRKARLQREQQGDDNMNNSDAESRTTSSSTRRRGPGRPRLHSPGKHRSLIGLRHRGRGHASKTRGSSSFGSGWGVRKAMRGQPDIVWPRADYGLFALLRGFLTQGGERRRLTSAQLCEYVREWQTYNGIKLQRTGSAWSWISRTEDWSAVTLHALQFLTAEQNSPGPKTTHQTPQGANVRRASRRLVCPRPFVDSRPRVHQWSWLLAPPPPNTAAFRNSSTCEEASIQFEQEMLELSDLFAEWVRAPRGLGGLADAEFLASSKATSSIVANPGRRKPPAMEMDTPRGRQSESDADNDYEDGRDEGRLQIIGSLSDAASQGDYDFDDEMDDDAVDDTTDNRAEAGGPPMKKPRGLGRPISKPGKSSRPMVTTTLDDSVPLPLCTTTWRLRPFTEDQRLAFQAQERERFSRPSTPYVYHVQDYTCIVSPLRSAAASAYGPDQRSHTTRARDHPLLRPDRPIHVSLAEIVRDAVACLPNGEGTRADITTLVQNSGFLLSMVDQRKLQQCVSSALDRLQGESPDPSLYFHATRRVWVYRHRHRTAEEFAILHEDRCAMLETKRSLQRGGAPTRTSTAVAVATTPRIYNDTRRLHAQQPSSMAHHGGTSVRGSHGQEARFHRPDMNMLVRPQSDYFSDAHIPDIEELEAADMMRRSRGNNMSDYPRHRPSGDDYYVTSGSEAYSDAGDGDYEEAQEAMRLMSRVPRGQSRPRLLRDPVDHARRRQNRQRAAPHAVNRGSGHQGRGGTQFQARRNVRVGMAREYLRQQQPQQHHQWPVEQWNVDERNEEELVNGEEEYYYDDDDDDQFMDIHQSLQQHSGGRFV